MNAKTPQFPRGGRRANDQHTGPEGSVSLDFDRKAFHVHDGDTPGGDIWLAFPEAPKDGRYYSRRLGQWVPVPMRPDPPDDGDYIRQADQWVALPDTTWATTMVTQLGSLSDRITTQTSRISDLSAVVEANNQARTATDTTLDNKITSVGDRVTDLEASGGLTQEKIALLSEPLTTDVFRVSTTLSVPTDFLLERIYIKMSSSERRVLSTDTMAQLPDGVVTGGGHYYTFEVVYLKDNELRTFAYKDEIDTSLVADTGIDFTSVSSPVAHERLTVARGNSTDYPYAVVVANTSIKCFSTTDGTLLFEETFSSNVLKVRWAEKTHRLLVMLDTPGKLHQVELVDDVWTASELTIDVSPGVLETGHDGVLGTSQENGVCAVTNSDGDLVVYDTTTMNEHVNLGPVYSDSGVSLHGNVFILFQRPNGQVIHYDLTKKDIVYQQQFVSYPQLLSYGRYGTGFRWWATEKGANPYYVVSPLGGRGDYTTAYDDLTNYVVRRITAVNTSRYQLINLEPRLGTGLQPKVLFVNTDHGSLSIPLRLASDHRETVRSLIEVSHWDDDCVYGTVDPTRDVTLSGGGDIVADISKMYITGPTGATYQFVMVGHQL